MADAEKLLHEVADVVISCIKEKVLEAVEKAKAELPSNEIIEKCISAGMKQVGILFEKGKLFLPHVIIAADVLIMRKLMSFLCWSAESGSEHSFPIIFTQLTKNRNPSGQS